MAAVPLMAACAPVAAAVPWRPGVVSVVAAERQYADVASAVGGRYVHVISLIDDPNTDPHSFELSPRVAATVARAQIVVQNGLGYDSFMDSLERALPSRGRTVIVAYRAAGFPAATANPHIWYDPSTMPAVAAALAARLSALLPDSAAYFATRYQAFVASLGPWRAALARLRARSGGAPVSATEPVAGWLLAAAGLSDRTPPGLEDDVMNGVDPSPRALAAERAMLAGRRVRLLVYNGQVTDSVTADLASVARRAGVPVVGAAEILPAGLDYAEWMLSETVALQAALAR